jgi:hypothetical protein
MKVQTLRIYMHFSGWKRVSLEKLQCDLQRPYIFSHFFETFTSIIEVSRLGSLRWHSESTLYTEETLKNISGAICYISAISNHFFCQKLDQSMNFNFTSRDYCMSYVKILSFDVLEKKTK